MKKLIIYDHLGVKQLEQEVFVDGENFVYDAIKPTCIWLGTILITDKEPEPELMSALAKEAVVEELSEEEELEQVPYLEETEEVVSVMEPIAEEVTSELETVSDKGTGEPGVSEAEQPESVKAPVKKSTRRKAAKRSK